MERLYLDDVPGRDRVNFEEVKLLENNQREHYTLHKIVLKGDIDYCALLTSLAALPAERKTKSDLVEGFLKGIIILKQLSHENVISFLGCLEDREREIYKVATEFSSIGSVYERLRQDSRLLSGNLFLLWCQQSSNAIKYIHNKDIIHNDIRSRNFVIFAEGRIKLTGFTFSKVTVNTNSSRGVDPNDFDYNLPWQAPEVLTENEVSKKSDIYSLGVFFWELITKKIPFKGLKSWEIIESVEEGGRPRLPGRCPEDLQRLLEKTWAKLDNRFTIDDVLLALNELQKQGTYELCVFAMLSYYQSLHES